jgi:CheY-like chemotaxis protein
MRTPKILLIQQDAPTHEALRRLLVRRGCSVFEARGQKEAVRLAARIRPDLVVQEEAVPAPDRAGALDEVMEAIEILAGPLRGRDARRRLPPGATRPLPRRRPPEVARGHGNARRKAAVTGAGAWAVAERPVSE